MLEFIYKKKENIKLYFVFCMDDINKTYSFNSTLSKGKIKQKNCEQTVLLKT